MQKETADAKAELAEMERIKELYGKAYLATRDAVEERAKEQSYETNSAKNLENNMNEEYNGDINYSLKDFVNEGYSTEGTKWAIANGLLTKNEQAKFWEDIANLSKRGYYIPKNKNGQYIIDVGQKLVFTNGDFKTATISGIVEFTDGYEANINDYKEWIIDEERNTAQHGESIQIIEIVQGEGYVSEHLPSAYRTDARENRRGKGTDSKRNSSIDENGVNKSYSLKWHTGLTRAQIDAVEKWVRNAGSPEATRITNTANWYNGRLNGRNLFVIYSKEVVDSPTVLYVSKDQKARVEFDILMDLLEEIENGTNINGKPSFAQRVSKGNWVSNVNSGRHNISRLGSGQNNQNAGVLQGQSQGKPSRAFENVIRNLFEIQEKSYLLKDNEGNTLTDAQQEYFKDSVVRDENGSLLVVYHGSPESFTIFDTHKDTSSIIYDASFFTSDESRATAYANKNNTTGQVYKGYLNIKNPLMPSRVREQISLIPDSVKEKYQSEFDIEESVSKTDYTIIDFAKYVARKENSTMATVLKNWGFDGYVNGKDYAIFEPEQFKNIDNTNPTGNPDINYSLKDENSPNNFGIKMSEDYNVNTSRSLFTDEVIFSSRYNAITQSQSIRKLYDSAKKANVESAYNLLSHLLGEDDINKIKSFGNDVYLIPVVGAEGTSTNVLPQMIAKYVSVETEQTVFEGIYKKTPSNSRGETVWERMKENYPSFVIGNDGNIKTSDIVGQKFVLIDDNSTTGRTFVGFKNFLEENGGKVVGYYALTTGHDQSEKMITTAETWSEILSLGVEIVKNFAEKEGVKREISEFGLTEREAQELVKQFRKKGFDSRRRNEDVARSSRGGREVRSVYETEKKDGDTERLNEDTNFSLKGTNNISTKERKELLDIIEHLKGEFELTKFAKADPKKLARMTREVLKEYESKADPKETFKAIDELYKYMANGEDGHPAVWEEVYSRAYNIAEKIVENALVVDDYFYQEYKSLRDYLRNTPMKFNSKYDSVPPGYTL